MLGIWQVPTMSETVSSIAIVVYLQGDFSVLERTLSPRTFVWRAEEDKSITLPHDA